MLLQRCVVEDISCVSLLFWVYRSLLEQRTARQFHNAQCSFFILCCITCVYVRISMLRKSKSNQDIYWDSLTENGNLSSFFHTYVGSDLHHFISCAKHKRPNGRDMVKASTISLMLYWLSEVCGLSWWKHFLILREIHVNMCYDNCYKLKRSSSQRIDLWDTVTCLVNQGWPKLCWWHRRDLHWIYLFELMKKRQCCQLEGFTFIHLHLSKVTGAFNI